MIMIIIINFFFFFFLCKVMAGLKGPVWLALLLPMKIRF